MLDVQENATQPALEFAVQEDSLTTRIRQWLEEHPQFREHARALTIEKREQTIVLSGRLPSYYVKQILQEEVRKFFGVQYIDNRTYVTRN